MTDKMDQGRIMTDSMVNEIQKSIELGKAAGRQIIELRAERDKFQHACQAMVAVFDRHAEDKEVESWDKDARVAYQLGQEAVDA